MKKIILMLVIGFMLVGCGSNMSSIDIDKTEDVIEKTLKNMTVIEDGTLTDVYGLDLSKMEEYVIKQNTDGDLYAIIKTNEKNLVKNDMDNYFDKIKQFNTAYSPERLEILEDRLEKEIGDYLIYIVASDAQDIYNEILDSME